MRYNDAAKRVNRNKPVDPPQGWGEDAEDDHHDRACYVEDESEFEAPEDLEDLFEESCILQFLACRAPGHIDGEKMGKNSLRNVQRDAA